MFSRSSRSRSSGDSTFWMIAFLLVIVLIIALPLVIHTLVAIFWALAVVAAVWLITKYLGFSLGSPIYLVLFLALSLFFLPRGLFGVIVIVAGVATIGFLVYGGWNRRGI